MEAKEALAQAKAITQMVNLGEINYDQGKELAQPYIDIVNNKAREIAKKYGKKPMNIINFTRLRR